MIGPITVQASLALMVPVLTLVFALGEQFRWWDKLSGRDEAIQGKEHFYSAEGYPKTWIYKDKKEDKAIFAALEKRINRHTSNRTAKDLIKQGFRPHLLTIGGHPFQISGLEPEMKSAVYSDVHPVMYIYFLDDREAGANKTIQVATLGELSGWLEGEKANRRFWVTSVSVGMLAVVISFTRTTLFGS